MYFIATNCAIYPVLVRICRKCYFRELPGEITNNQPGDDQLINANTFYNYIFPATPVPESVDEDIIKISHLNCLSLNTDINELRHLARKTDIDILTLSETHLNDLIEDSELDIDSYYVMCKDKTRADGGVAICINNTIVCKDRPDLVEPDLEILIIEVMMCNAKSFYYFDCMV